ncbi:MAG: hypothetical protein CML99_06490 [Rhodobiaceae bacterium]|nr:hypothetical protein [Rhodobiaceae bacterium]|tara:strand:- start:578 stop:1984 length:1407 start_codon:yes stop_codon:yes gene_type:complete
MNLSMQKHHWPIGPYQVRLPGIVLFLAMLLGVNCFNIVVLENGFSITDHFTNLGISKDYYAKSWWEYLLPQREVYGTWASTSVVLGALVQQVLHPAIVLIFSQSVLIVVGFVVALRMSGSIVFAATVALLFFTVPFNYHVYSVHGTTAHGLLMSYFLLFIDASIALIRGHTRRRDFVYFGIATVLFVLGYETWIDVVVVMVLVALPVWMALRRNVDYETAARFMRLVGFIIGLTVVYVIAKVSWGFGSGAGTETDLVFFYGFLSPIWDDYVTKVIAFSFTAASLVLPPELVSSSSLMRMGPDWLVAQQHGYHPQMQFLTYANHIFLWRFYAGIVFALLLVLAVYAWLKAWEGRTDWRIWVMLFCVAMVLFGASTHSLVKYRPMHSMPYLGYQVWVNVIGTVGLVALAVDWLVGLRKKAALAFVAIAWTYLIWVGFSVRSALGIYVATMQMGTYPNPIRNLVALIAQLF